MRIEYLNIPGCTSLFDLDFYLEDVVYITFVPFQVNLNYYNQTDSFQFHKFLHKQ